MNKLALFVPLTKVDAVKRLVYGVAAAEVPDKSGEILDYVSSVPAFKSWSDEIAKNTAHLGDERSLGNVRAMHGRVAAGKLTEISFDDTAKAVNVCAHIVDEAEWNKVAKGVYGGFSIGGGYAKTWPDPEDSKLRRYTPTLSEISIVDNPCIPGATFRMIKADGLEEDVEIVGEPTSAMVEHPEGHLFTALKDVHPDLTVKALTKAAAGIVAANRGDKTADEWTALAKAWAPTPTAADVLADALEKAADEKPAGDYGDVHYADPGYQPDKKPRYPVDSEKHIRAAWNYINKSKNAAKYTDSQVGKIKGVIVAAWKETIDKDGPPSADKLAAFTPAALKELIGAVEAAPCWKGMWTLSWVARLMEEIECLENSVEYEEAMEQDADSKLPMMVRALCQSFAEMLTTMAEEEVAELLDGKDVDASGVFCCPPAMLMATAIVDMTKADAAVMEKAGKRNSKSDASHIQAMHDHSMALGATCDSGNCADDDAEKTTEALMVKAAERINTLAESEAAATAKIADLEKANTDLAGRLTKLEAQPMPPKGQLIVVDREGEVVDPAVVGPRNWKEHIDSLPKGRERAEAILKYAGGAPFNRAAV